MAHAVCFLCTFLLFVCHFQYFCSGRDTIKAGDLIHDRDNDTIVSAGNIFTLGFFSPGKASGRYVGIWYSNSTEVIVWVANRENPVPPTGFGTFGIDITNSNLKVSTNLTYTYFSTNLTNSYKSRRYNLSTATLYDTGNLVLTDKGGRKIWESFEHPTDTLLQGMKMDAKLTLTSWRSNEDPAPGSYLFQQDGVHFTESGIKYHWKTGKESADSFIPKQNISISDAVLYLSGNGTNPKSCDSSCSKNFNLTANGINPTSCIISCSKVFDSNWRLWMRPDGKIQFLRWENKTWSVILSEPQGNCSIYNFCGSYGICKPESQNSTSCTCFPGYQPANEEDWNSDEFSGGCKKKPSKCNGDNTTSFQPLNVTMVRSNTPIVRYDISEDDCKSICQDNCSCQAYSYRRDNIRDRSSTGCWFWYDNLFNIQEGYTHANYTIFFREDPPPSDTVSDPGLSLQPIGNQQRNTNSISVRSVIIATTVIFAVALLCSITYISYRRVVAKGKDRNINENQTPRLHDNEILMDQGDQFGEDDKKDIDIPFFELEIILAATDNFSQAQKLGQGGFGPVYKGKFPGGEEIAVKRLSSNSRQGLVEFKNEVVLIAKLQHRNLVRLLGYCIKGNERILLYEYMPNKSLDAFIFDDKLRTLLNWATRFDIIVGIARGLLYLHQDSRLRIIHRDMKASNILLDEEMNPKISDFGLARIVGRRETESNTTRVMGTYGYMAPEYAVEGQFSVKSDAFSFGVVVLEIISGKKNTGFFDSQLALSLLGYAWSLWKEEKPLTLLDETLVGACNEREVLKCIAVGLLCVQEDPDDRPNMSKVVIMLSSETETIPNPKQPAFVTRKRFYGSTSSSSTKPGLGTLSKNEITFSEAEGR